MNIGYVWMHIGLSFKLYFEVCVCVRRQIIQSVNFEIWNMKNYNVSLFSSLRFLIVIYFTVQNYTFRWREIRFHRHELSEWIYNGQFSLLLERKKWNFESYDARRRSKKESKKKREKRQKLSHSPEIASCNPSSIQLQHSLHFKWTQHIPAESFSFNCFKSKRRQIIRNG